MQGAGPYLYKISIRRLARLRFFWIQDCNLKKEEWRNAIEYYSGDFGHIELVTCLKLAIKHFEELEEFERCAFLKNIQDYTEKYLLLKSMKEA